MVEDSFRGKWVLRQGKGYLEKSGKRLYFYFPDNEDKELLLACGLFTASKIEKDLALFTLVVTFSAVAALVLLLV